MRSSLLVLALLGCFCAATAVSAGSFSDPDDAALMEIGVDLSAEARAQPTPTFVFDLPANHKVPLMAQFPLVHEIQGVEAQDWKDIQGLLTREPRVAEESSVDMKLDELEEQFKRVDAKSTAAPRLAQVAAPPPAPAAASRKAAAPAARAPVVRSAAPKPAVASNKAAAAAPKVVVKATAAPVAAAATPAAAPVAAAAAAAPAADKTAAAATTARLIEKRLRGLAILFKRFKSQTGVGAKDKSNARVTAALNKQKKDAAALKKRLAKKGIVRFAQQSLEQELEQDQEEDASFMESEAESQLESEVESEAEVAADAEAIDSILDTLM